MSGIFDRPGGMEAVKEWNAARDSHREAKAEYDAAREKLWAAKVRMAAAHKNGEEVAGPELASMFMWIEELDGKRDEILAVAACNCPGGNKPANLHAPNCPTRAALARVGGAA